MSEATKKPSFREPSITAKAAENQQKPDNEQTEQKELKNKKKSPYSSLKNPTSGSMNLLNPPNSATNLNLLKATLSDRSILTNKTNGPNPLSSAKKAPKKSKRVKKNPNPLKQITKKSSTKPTPTRPIKEIYFYDPTAEKVEKNYSRSFFKKKELWNANTCYVKPLSKYGSARSKKGFAVRFFQMTQPGISENQAHRIVLKNMGMEDERKKPFEPFNQETIETRETKKEKKEAEKYWILGEPRKSLFTLDLKNKKKGRKRRGLFMDDEKFNLKDFKVKEFKFEGEDLSGGD